MVDTEPFALLVLVVAGLGLAAVLSNQLTTWVKLPAPVLFLAIAAIAVSLFPSLHGPPEQTVSNVVSIALVFILFDGGMHIGWTRFRSAASPIAVLGVLGTFLTVAAGASFVYFAIGLGWFSSLLIATAVAPTDPAVVFSVLGRNEISGASGTILEGESGANDPVGIALMTSLISAGTLNAGVFAHVGGQFLSQMGIGGAIGIAGGLALGWLMRRIPLPSEGLYPLRSAVGVLLLFAVATVAHGSGFLSVFVAGIVVGDDGRAPYKREIERFHAALASLAEIVAFVVLGLTVHLDIVLRIDVWAPGVLIGAALAFVIRPIVVGLCLIPARLANNQRNFVLFGGLKGAVPILLGSYLLDAHVPDVQRLYGIVVVVVVFSVVVQGSLMPTAARLLRVPLRKVELEPWSLGVRLQDEPSGVHRLTVAAGSSAEGCTLDGIVGLPVDARISLLVRRGQLVPVRLNTTLQVGDEVLVQASPDDSYLLSAIFEDPRGLEDT
jgi:cell volume regulation protein A